ncbi:hypothetical protein [Christiangramia crocea]|uniref:Uncharacterized protein n=1 Tax=Christiangramia crocea TaxID=2904124 RepID=A0A9X1UWX7_9FLAO|nr:hypothetical protein [Gramella crocea]MCG9971014.1 hypothetical protein [Gramella crocea]
MERKTKATEIIDKHLGKKQAKEIFENNEPLWDDIVDAVDEALLVNKELLESLQTLLDFNTVRTFTWHDEDVKKAKKAIEKALK